jgi:hypothetical protein
MQSYDENNRMLGGAILESHEDMTRELSKPRVKHIVIGKLPYKGDKVEINGLRYQVKKRDIKNKQLILELLT